MYCYSTLIIILDDLFVGTHLNGSKYSYVSLEIQLNIRHLFANS